MIGFGALIATTAGCKVDQPVLPTDFQGSSVAEGTFGTSSTDTSPGGPTTLNGITSPTIVSPLPGASFTDPRPTLTVENSRDEAGGTLIYEFQVAIDDGFQNVATQKLDVSEGGGGLTFWRVEALLGDNRYFWRARARNASVAGSYSPISDFTIQSAGGGGGGGGGGGSPPAPTPAGLEVSDPLTNFGSAGELSGGRFSNAGWQVTQRGNYIRYRVTPISQGFVQWENINLAPFNPVRDQFSLLGMWDPTRGDYRENPFRVHVRKLDTNGHRPPYLRMRWIANGEQHDEGNDFLEWNPNQAYQFRLEWGSGLAVLSLDGRSMIRVDYNRSYSPEQHWIELGIEERSESIVGTIYRNVQIGRR